MLRLKCNDCGTTRDVEPGATVTACPTCSEPPAPRTGEEVAALMDAAWPLPGGAKWEAWELMKASQSATGAKVRAGAVQLQVRHYRGGEQHVNLAVGYTVEIYLFDGDEGPGTFDRGRFLYRGHDTDRAAAVSALRAAYDRLCADLRALAPAGDEDDAEPCGCEESVSLRGELADALRERDANAEEYIRKRRALAAAEARARDDAQGRARMVAAIEAIQATVARFSKPGSRVQDDVATMAGALVEAEAADAAGSRRA